MMYVDDGFLLKTATSKTIYEAIKDLPIVDYHNHLSAKEIYLNEPFEDISEEWLGHDHYKWRLMRFAGQNDREDDTRSAFLNYASALQHAYMNPLYHWTHMELSIIFGIDECLSETNASRIYDKINKRLTENPLRPRALLKSFNTEILCTTNDIHDSLAYHKKISEDESCSIKVLPTFRPDVLFTDDNASFLSAIESFSDDIKSWKDFKHGLLKRMDHFSNHGCQLADFGFTHFQFDVTKKFNIDDLFERRLNNERLSEDERCHYDSHLLLFFMKEMAKRHWTVQFHVGPLRNCNTKAFEKFGKDAGYDSISHDDFINDFNRFLNTANTEFDLPEMIVYSINPHDYEAIATMCLNFTKDSPGKIQLGSAWWFNDHHRGINRLLNTFSAYLHLGFYKGMVTDSRSFFSFVRHDYFRRILANFLGEKIEEGLIPKQMEAIIRVAKDISYHNSKKMFINNQGGK